MRCARLTVLVTLFVCVSACGGKTGPSEVPTLSTETFTGTIDPLGASSHPFTVRYEAGYTDASITVNSLTAVSNGAAAATTIGVAFGNMNQGVCTRAPSYSILATLNQELPTSDQPFIAGTFCIQIFDHPDSPTVTEPVNYSLTVKHY